MQCNAMYAFQALEWLTSLDDSYKATPVVPEHHEYGSNKAPNMPLIYMNGNISICIGCNSQHIPFNIDICMSLCVCACVCNHRLSILRHDRNKEIEREPERKDETEK